MMGNTDIISYIKNFDNFTKLKKIAKEKENKVKEKQLEEARKYKNKSRSKARNQKEYFTI